MTVTERWRPVVGHPQYMVSDQGRAAKLVGRRTVNGYTAVYISTPKGKTSDRLAHRLVLAAFLGPLPPGTEVNHKNGVRHDNRLVNLEYTTRSENLLHRHRVLGVPGPNRRLSARTVKAIRESTGRISSLEWFRRTGVTPSVIRRIRLGESYREVGGPLGGARIYRRGTEHHKCKLTERQVRAIRNSGEIARVWAERLGVSNSTIHFVRQRRSWKHIR